MATRARRVGGQLAWLLLAACGGATAAPAPPPLRVFAAASLQAPFQAIAKAYEQAHGQVVELHTAGSSQLVVQLREGAPAAVFAAADQPNLQRVVDLGRTVGAPRTFAHNHLAIVVGKGNPRSIRSLADLARPELRVALCGPEVPIGSYAREALAKAAVTVASRSDEPNVAALVTKVRLGELDAAIAYATDAGGEVEAVPVAAAHDVQATYPIVVLQGDQAAAGERFVAFVCGPQGRAALRDHGFTVP